MGKKEYRFNVDARRRNGSIYVFEEKISFILITMEIATKENS